MVGYTRSQVRSTERVVCYFLKTVSGKLAVWRRAAESAIDEVFSQCVDLEDGERESIARKVPSKSRSLSY